MTEKSNSKDKNDNKTLFNNSPKIPKLNEKIQNKMKKYKMTNFNFVLENDKVGITENKIIPEKSNNDEEIIKIQEFSTDETEKNKVQKNNNNSENFIIIPIEESPKNEKKYQTIPQYSDFSFGKKNNQFSTHNKHFENNNYINLSNEYDKNKENKIKYENVDVVCEGFENFDEYNTNKSNNIIVLNEDNNNNLNNNNNNLLGKKKKFENNSPKPNNDIKTDNFININNNSKLDVQKYMILKLVEKYSYKYIFNLFIKQCAKNIVEINNNCDKEIENILNELIKEIGVEKMMTILLSLTNNYSNKKNMEKINEINNNDLEIIYLDEEENDYVNFKKENNNLICIKENSQSEEMKKKHIIINENNFNNHINENNEENLQNYLFSCFNSSGNSNIKNEKK